MSVPSGLCVPKYGLGSIRELDRGYLLEGFFGLNCVGGDIVAVL
jgi:hypothetical protein